METTSTMAERLRYAMEMNEITAAELARRTGCHKSSISMYLKGEHKASAKGAERLAAILNVSPAWLLGYDVQITPDPQEGQQNGSLNLNDKRFIRVGDTTVNLDHVITITHQEDGIVSVLLDTGCTVAGNIVA